MKNRIFGNPQTSLTSVALLVFLAVVVWLRPTLLDKPETLILLAAGIAPLFLKDSK